jgi:hypothetical protein
MNDNLINFKEEIISSIKEIKKETDDNFKILKLEMASRVNEMKKKTDDNLRNLKVEMISSIKEMKKETDDNFKDLKLEMISIVNEMIKEIASSFKKLNPFLFGTPYGIQNNIHVSKLTESGYSYVYNKPYNHKTTSSEMDKIKSSCLSTTNLCLGGRDSKNDVLLVLSCGLCSVVFNKTTVNTPNLHNGAYWYYTPDVSGSQSMGFAPNSTINQGYVDIFDDFNNQRVSWNLQGWGAYRLGSLTSLHANTRYYKVILRRDD